MVRELNIALIGCGSWGKNIARNLHQMGSLACIYDSNSELSEKLNHEYMLPNLELNKMVPFSVATFSYPLTFVYL